MAPAQLLPELFRPLLKYQRVEGMSFQINLLVAEDDANDRLLLQRAFRVAGTRADIIFVKDGEEAVEYLKGAAGFADRTRFPFPHLMLLDIKMPKLDGFGVLQWLRAQPGFGRLPVIVFSSSDREDDIARAHDMGANSYLVKTPSSNGMAQIAHALDSYWAGHNMFPSCSRPER